MSCSITLRVAEWIKLLAYWRKLLVRFSGLVYKLQATTSNGGLFGTGLLLEGMVLTFVQSPLLLELAQLRL